MKKLCLGLGLLMVASIALPKNAAIESESVTYKKNKTGGLVRIASETRVEMVEIDPDAEIAQLQAQIDAWQAVKDASVSAGNLSAENEAKLK